MASVLAAAAVVLMKLLRDVDMMISFPTGRLVSWSHHMIFDSYCHANNVNCYTNFRGSRSDAPF